MTSKCLRAHRAEVTCSFCEAFFFFFDFSALSPNFSLQCRQQGVKAAALKVLLRYRTQYLVDLQDFSPLVSGRAALGSRAILVLRAVVLNKWNQQL